MPFPVDVITRPVSVGGAMVLESSGMLSLRVVVRASKSLVRDATGYRFEKLGVTSQGGPGAEVVINLPVTDQAGWKDPTLNALIDVSVANSYTHQYTAEVHFTDSDGNAVGIPAIELGPFVVPSGDTVIDLDKNVPASTIAGGAVSIPDIWSQKVAEAEAVAAELQALIPTTSAAVAQAVTTDGPAKQALNTTFAPVSVKDTVETGRLSDANVTSKIGTVVAPANKRAVLASTRPATVIALGTSITNQGSFNTSGGANQFQNGTDDVGYLSHAIVRLNHSLRVLRNAGVSGNNSAQMLARLQADVLDYAPGWVIVETGAPNDIGFGMTLAQSIANHKAIYDAIEATGARVVATTPMPYGLNDASNSAGRRQFISGLRRWIVKYAQERGHVLVDFYPALVREDGTGLWRGTGWSDGTNATQSDGIHPKPPAAALAGKILADALRPHIADRKSLWLPGGNVDAWNLLANGMMFGTGGTTKPTGVTGDLATSWAAYGAAGSGGAGTLSKVARTDGINGEWQQYTATAGNADGFNFQQQNQAGLGTTWNVGDVVVAAVEFETDADWVGGVQMGLLLSATGSSSAVQDLRHAGSNTGWSPGAASGVLAAKMTVGAGATRLQVQASVRMTTGTVRFGRAGLWNITQMVAAGIIDAEFLTAPTV